MEISFSMVNNQNTISYDEAKKLFEISKLKKQLESKKETARYLYGKKRGAWGRMTMADEKRSSAIDNLKFKIQMLESNLTKSENLAGCAL